ncbi:MAG: type II secretion system F family protein, partial [Oscillospiraceae bacterium]
RQAEKKRVKEVMLNLYESIKKGNSLSAALKEQGKAFPALLISMVESGEASGTLDDVMLTMSTHYEKEKILHGKIKSAMIYPIALIVVCIAVVILLLTFVMPTFFDMFEDKGDLPGTTKMLLALSQFLTKYWYVALMLLACMVVGGFFLIKVESVRMFIDRAKVKMPAIGKLQTTIITARFARTISSLYAGGVPIIDCIKIAANVMGNLYISERLGFVIDEIKRGVSFSQALISADCFPQMFSSMVFIGEESGSLDEILEKTANFYDDDASAAISKMVALMEPCMIVVMGLIVGGIVVSIATPMFTMYDQID